MVACWAVALIFSTSAGCGDAGDADPGGGATDDPGASDTGSISIVDQDTSGGDTQSADDACDPGQLFCTDANERAECDDDGEGWDVLVPCSAPQVCEPESVLCKSPLCEPGEQKCTGAQTAGTCNETGTSFIDDVTCDEGNGCDEETLGCVTWVCEPGAVWCDASGVVQRCWDNGLGSVAHSNCGSGAGCSGCLGSKTEAACVGVPAGEAPELVDCVGLEACIADIGCTAFECNAVLTPCLDASDDPGCIAMTACIPLPPLHPTPDTAVSASTVLGVSVVAGGTPPTGPGAFINVAPVYNPQSGLYLEDLGAAEITLLEDGQPKVLTCSPVHDSPYAFSDIVFVIDETGSMDWVIDAVKTNAVTLAEHLTEVGLDVRFGAVSFKDIVLPVPTSDWFLPLSPDASDLASFMATLLALDGGDEAENPMDAIMVAWDQMDWRPGAERVFVLFTDAPVHTAADGWEYTELHLVEVLAELVRDAVVHTVSPDFDREPCFTGETVNPRMLSCGTGGSSTELLSSDSLGDLTGSAFAEALSEATICTFSSSAPGESHTLEVTVTTTWNGQVLSGSTIVEGATYPPP